MSTTEGRYSPGPCQWVHVAEFPHEAVSQEAEKMECMNSDAFLLFPFSIQPRILTHGMVPPTFRKGLQPLEMPSQTYLKVVP